MVSYTYTTEVRDVEGTSPVLGSRGAQGLLLPPVPDLPPYSVPIPVRIGGFGSTVWGPVVDTLDYGSVSDLRGEVVSRGPDLQSSSCPPAHP